MTLKAALEALSHDAGTWTDVSSALSSASSAAGGLTVGPLTWPAVVGDVPLASTYEELRAKVETLLQQGSEEATKISDELLATKKAYEDSDQSSRAELHGVWDPVP